MKPYYYQDNHVTIYNKDCRDMSELSDNSVQCVVTSPPYWGLRKYSGEQDLIWGGDKDCEHEWGKAKITRKGHAGTKSTLVGTQTAEISKAADTFGSDCLLCGAMKCGYGLEPTPEMYVQHTIEILREIRRVLRKDGVVFFNIGDSYAANRSYQVTDTKWRDVGNTKPSQVPEGLKPKDLCLIPFRVAIAAQEDGWWVRSVIIWNKPNPMPESVKDRPTESHEYILMLTKSARYYWDQEAVREKPVDDYETWLHKRGDNPKYQGSNLKANHAATSTYNPAGRNLRSVWSFPTQPYPEAHFAVFPEKLPELCIKAATPEVGCCAECGAPWERMMEKTGHINKREPAHVPNNTPTKTDSTGWSLMAMSTNNWKPTCKCNADKVPSIVLDPFSGASTTLWVAKRLNRQAVGYDLAAEYCKLGLDRNRQQVMV